MPFLVLDIKHRMLTNCFNNRAYGYSTMPIWNTNDRDQITINYQNVNDGSKKDSCLAGRKGLVVKILVLVVIFFVGLIIGYIIRRQVHETIIKRMMVPIKIVNYNDTVSQMARDKINSERIRENLKAVTNQGVHMSGTKKNSVIMGKIKKLLTDAHLDNVKVHEYRVLLSYPGYELHPPAPNKIQLLNANNTPLYSYQTVDSQVPGDAEKWTYIPFSPNGTAQGDLVYVNYGQESDYKQLSSLGVNVTGKIVLMRYGKDDGYLTEQVRVAELNGVIGILIYSDPVDHGPYLPIQPNTRRYWWLPKDGVRRSSIKNAWGDMATCGYPAKEELYTLTGNSYQNHYKMPKIPVQPISYGDADKLLKNLTEINFPPQWYKTLGLHIAASGQGQLPNQYHVSTLKEQREVRIETFNQVIKKTINNVRGVIRGIQEPESIVIVGAHYDSLTTGGIDPGSGLSILMELVTVFGEMKAAGWRPKRTIMFMFWDASDYGNIGSWEFVQEFEKDLLSWAVSYINLAAAVTGNYSFSANGHPLMKQIVFEATKTVQCPDPDHGDMTVYDMWAKRFPDNLHGGKTPQLDPFNKSGDYEPFDLHLAIPSIDMQYTFDRNKWKMEHYPAYHTDYDNEAYVDAFIEIDHKVVMHTAVAKITADIILRLSDTDIIPFDVEDFANYLAIAVNDTMQADEGNKYGVQLDYLTKQILQFYNAAIDFKKELKVLQATPQKGKGWKKFIALRYVNMLLIEVSRVFGRLFREQDQCSSYVPLYLQKGFRSITYAMQLEKPGVVQDRTKHNVKEEIAMVITQVLEATAILKKSVYFPFMDFNKNEL